ncbi:MAG TPA: peptidoglycan-associated lipoprotein Pal [Gemmatimonadaceae bacterium]|nr:peptidoglycan-associated lipoprotein Pal [Gemmatimonadaceae bacterium]
MIRTSRLIPVLTLAAVVLGGSACRRQPEAAPMPEPTVNQDSIDAANRARAEAEARERARMDSINRANAAAEEARRAEAARIAALRNTLMEAIYFDFDSDGLSADARSRLDAKLAILNANSGLTLRIAGHADERGSDEYNLALGQRRAAAAKRYLTQRGIADDRIAIISYGEERPAVQGSDESAWSQNRRDEFEITGGGDTLRSPGE